MTTDYNGWTNYETWNVNLWIENEEGSYRYWREVTRECIDAAEADGTFTKEERAALDLMERLKDKITEGAPDLGASMYSDILGAALSDVNWMEIARSMIDNETDN